MLSFFYKKSIKKCIQYNFLLTLQTIACYNAVDVKCVREAGSKIIRAASLLFLNNQPSRNDAAEEGTEKGKRKMKFDKEGVRGILPHRPPFLLVDEVVEVIPLEKVHATFYADPEWAVLEGHFPDDPVVPGVCCVESIAQAFDIAIMTDEKYKDKTPLFAGITDVRFHSKFSPGETADVFVTVTKIDQDRDLITGDGELYVGDRLCAKATVMIAPR